MICGIHQLHYLPWLRYFDKIARSDVFVILDNIQYNKSGWQNRNKIKGDGGPMLLSVPVHAPHGCLLHEVTIDDTQPWRRKHLQAIRQQYGRAPYFTQYADFLDETYTRVWKTLNALNRHMLAFFLQALGIHTRVAYSSDFNVPGIATGRLINLIRAVGADTYFSGAYALDCYLDAAQLASAGIGLRLQDWRAPVYPQLHGPFVADLSVLDLLMQCGPDSLDVLMGERVA